MGEITIKQTIINMSHCRSCRYYHLCSTACAEEHRLTSCPATANHINTPTATAAATVTSSAAAAVGSSGVGSVRPSFNGRYPNLAMIFPAIWRSSSYMAAINTIDLHAHMHMISRMLLCVTQSLSYPFYVDPSIYPIIISFVELIELS